MLVNVKLYLCGMLGNVDVWISVYLKENDLQDMQLIKRY